MASRSLLLLLALASHVVAQEQDLTALSLEDFMKIEVTSARRGAQRLSRTAAAVHVITHDDIRRSGATNLPEALRLAPGVHVARVNGSVWSVSIRGFGSFYSNKLLVMIDGRTIYSPVMSGVDWSRHLVVMEDIDRIEVIRGPAGSVWGANAVNGVINVITRPASRTAGVLLHTTSGTLERGRVALRHGSVAGDTAWRTWVTHTALAQAVPQAGLPRLAPWQSSRAGFRMDHDAQSKGQWTLETEWFRTGADSYVTEYPAPYAVEFRRRDFGGPGGYARLEWGRNSKRWGETKIRGFVNVEDSNLGAVDLRIQTYDMDFQQSLLWRRRHGLVVGGGIRANRVRSGQSQLLWFQPASSVYTVANVFVQDDWDVISDRLTLSLGAKLERYTMAGSSLQPSLRVSLTPSDRQSYWIAVSGAVRAPSHADFAIRFPIGEHASTRLPFRMLLQGSDSFRPERLRAFEAGARWQLTRRALADVSVFHHRYNGLQAFESPIDIPGLPAPVPAEISLPDLPVTIRNAFRSKSSGADFATQVDLRRAWRVHGSFSLYRASTTVDARFRPARVFETLYTYPATSFSLRSEWEWKNRWSLHAGLQRYGALRFGETVEVPPVTRATLRLARRVGEFWEFSLDGKDLLRARRAEYAGAWLFPSGEITRSISVGLRWER